MSKKYQLAGIKNGSFGDVYDNLAAAEAALEKVIEECRDYDDRETTEGGDAPYAAYCFCIVEVV